MYNAIGMLLATDCQQRTNGNILAGQDPRPPIFGETIGILLLMIMLGINSRLSGTPMKSQRRNQMPGDYMIWPGILMNGVGMVTITILQAISDTGLQQGLTTVGQDQAKQEFLKVRIIQVNRHY
jgi:hypothetical protein